MPSAGGGEPSLPESCPPFPYNLELNGKREITSAGDSQPFMDKKDLSERDICTKFITPAVSAAGWDVYSQVREEVTLTNGRVQVRGKLAARGEAGRADYVLYHKPKIPLAVIEAKDNSHRVGDGMQQAQRYAEMLDVPFSFSSNGDAFLFHDATNTGGKVEREIPLSAFPAPDDLWSKYRAWKGLDDETTPVVVEDYFDDGSGKEPRYYQLNAINKTVEAVAKGQRRNLLVMATGTGKTYTAFQIIWRLWKARRAKRILFLADRNILVDQTRTNDFRPFGQAMTKITNRSVDKSYEIYLSLYQAITGKEEAKKIFKSFSPDFFDLVVIDECHRGSADEDSEWHEILEYFTGATHIGMTATPKETKDVSNLSYFGEPVYTYSLKQGIEDGFLAPYKVIRIDIDKDLTGWRPEAGKRDKHGREIEDRIYNVTDFDRSLVLEKRTELVARKVTEYLKATDRYAKTIVFCEDIDHAERMRRELVNLNGDLVAEDRRYVMRITGDEDEGKRELDNFILPDSKYPVIATTSELMSTGVDAQTCKLIVLDQTIRSIAKFKQIIGRGTRINEDYGKLYFTIMDFRKATELFADPNFDGPPIVIYEPGEDDPVAPPDDLPPEDEPSDGPYEPPDLEYPVDEDQPGGPRPKYVVNDVGVRVLSEREQYYDEDGKLTTESLKDYSRRKILDSYESLDTFLRRWSSEDKKEAIIEELAKQGVHFEALAGEVEHGSKFDAFDLVCHVAFDQPPLTRRERADSVKKRNYFTKYGDNARAVLEGLLDKYADQGIAEIEDLQILRLDPFNKVGTPIEIVREFGGPEAYEDAVKELEQQLYGTDAA